MPPASGPDTALNHAASEPSPAEELAWIESAQRGDQDAFAALVQAYGGLVYRVIGRLVRDPDDRDDLVQETFYRACKGLAGFRPGAAFRPWLVTIALNAARDHLRAKQRWAGVSLDDPDAGAAEERRLMATDPLPDEEAQASELRHRVEGAFERLDEQAQTILWLRVREELSYAEIANVLGIAVGTVMSRLSRARTALRGLLAESTPDQQQSPSVQGFSHDT